MKTLRMFAVFALVAMSLFAVTADAQEISVFFGTEMASTKQVKPMELFDISIVVSNINDNLNAVEYSLNLPANVAIVGSSYWNGTGLVFDGPDGTAIALGECVVVADIPGYSTSITVASLQAIAMDTFGQTPNTLTEYTYPGTPPNPATTPRYSNCSAQSVDLTAVNGSLQGVTVPTEASSFSKVKSLF
jgi:hypothetical protein